MFEKVSRSLKYDSNFFFDYRHIYIYGHRGRSLYPARAARAGVKNTGTRDELSITLYLQSEINFCSVRMPVNA